jgi:hypothetical protein
MDYDWWKGDCGHGDCDFDYDPVMFGNHTFIDTGGKKVSTVHAYTCALVRSYARTYIRSYAYARMHSHFHSCAINHTLIHHTPYTHELIHHFTIRCVLLEVTTAGPVELFAHFKKDLDMRFGGIRKPRSYSNVALSNTSGWLLPDKDSVGAGGNNW